jgi:hypothetical protein
MLPMKSSRYSEEINRLRFSVEESILTGPKLTSFHTDSAPGPAPLPATEIIPVLEHNLHIPRINYQSGSESSEEESDIVESLQAKYIRRTALN